MSQPRLFGTDGMRGKFGVTPLDELTVRRLGLALAQELAVDEPEGGVHVILGGDTRDSTPTLCQWLASGLAAGGARATFLGIVPTPAVAHVVLVRGATCGIAVSASHNPHPDNGIKLVGGDGFKWAPEREAALEARLDETGPPAAGSPPKLEIDEEAVAGYLASLVSSLPGERPLDGLTVALDTGHGAASAYAEKLFASLGAEVTLRNNAPDGTNINAGCGSTHPEVIAALTRESRSDIGFSFDGDADRVIIADEKGEVRDGDVVLFLWGRDLLAAERLPGKRLVATSMSNLGLEVALKREGIELVRCDVGDREVVATLRRLEATLGGEQSGHIVHLGLATTGDGLLTALQMAHLLKRSGQAFSDLAAPFERFPQLIKNVRVREKPPLEGIPTVAESARRIEEKLVGEGRLVLRYSGTESLARIMIEGRDKAEIAALAEELAAVIAAEIGVAA
jgi:phosphoglucosamine mutase